MFEGTAEELKETKVTQPAVFYTRLFYGNLIDFQTRNGSGTLGEFLHWYNGSLSFEDGLKLVSQRECNAKACRKSSLRLWQLF
jgi:[acyl-carrier-protein] S-malonyltransferase